MGEDQRAVFLRAFQQGKYWTIKIQIDTYDGEGTADDTQLVRTSLQMPLTDDPVDQAWVVLINGLHLLEAKGAAGRISGADWPALPI